METGLASGVRVPDDQAPGTPWVKFVTILFRILQSH
jgi:hypothetical protein